MNAKQAKSLRKQVQNMISIGVNLGVDDRSVRRAVTMATRKLAKVQVKVGKQAIQGV